MVKKILFTMLLLLGLFQISFAALSEQIVLPSEDKTASPSHPLGQVPVGGVNGKPVVVHPFYVNNEPVCPEGTVLVPGYGCI